MDDCKHKNQELRYRPGNNSYTMQCMVCGHTFGSIPHAKLSAEERNATLMVDDDISRRYWDARSVLRMEAAIDKREQERADWLLDHGEYLRSPEWRDRREAVLRRDGYVCQACMKNKATEVHHLSYKHWRREPLFELVAVCHYCHEQITQSDRARETVRL
jgi:hypothetical protein